MIAAAARAVTAVFRDGQDAVSVISVWMHALSICLTHVIGVSCSVRSWAEVMSQMLNVMYITLVAYIHFL